jgi:phosphoribosylformylglycinamidine synthase
MPWERKSNAALQAIWPFPVTDVRTVEVYSLDGDFDAHELKAIAAGPLCDPIIQRYTIDRPLERSSDWLIEVGFRPGVTDNVGKTAREAIALLLGNAPEDTAPVYTSRQYHLSGPLRTEVERIANDLLANDLIELTTLRR